MNFTDVILLLIYLFQGKFQINSKTGVLNVSDKLNREEQSTYMLIIEAWDNYQFGYASGESRNAFKQIG
jgi:hypothetical protein